LELGEEKMKKELKHTDGPWKFNKALLGVFSEKRTNLYNGDARDDLFVTYFDPKEYKSNQKPENLESNARLIATAPEMLRLIMVIYESNTRTKQHECMTNDCKELIEKATGEKIEDLI
jgi:hypothetical protein